MKIENRIKNIYIISFLVYLLLVIYGSFFVVNFYQNMKMRNLEEYLNHQENLTIKQIKNYANSHGFDIYRIDHGDQLLVDYAYDFVGEMGLIYLVEIDHVNKQALIYVESPVTNEIVFTYLVRVNSVLIIEVTTIATSMLIVSSLIIFIVLNLLFRKTITEIVKPMRHIKETLDMVKHFEFEKVANRENNILIEELHEIEDTIQKISAQLNEYLDDRHALTSALTHEIKSPVNSINSLLLGYLNQVPPYNDIDFVIPEIEVRLDEIVEISEHALALFEQKEYKKDNENANKVIYSLIEKHKFEFAQRGLKISLIGYDEQFIFHGNRELFELVLSNLFINILKYAKKDSEVKIVISETELIFENELTNQYLSGTQKGLKLANELLKAMRLDLTYKKRKPLYEVKITHVSS